MFENWKITTDWVRNERPDQKQCKKFLFYLVQSKNYEKEMLAADFGVSMKYIVETATGWKNCKDVEHLKNCTIRGIAHNNRVFFKYIDGPDLLISYENHRKILENPNKNRTKCVEPFNGELQIEEKTDIIDGIWKIVYPNDEVKRCISSSYDPSY